MTETPQEREFTTLLTRTSAFPQSVVSTIWCASCLLIMRNRGLFLQYKLNGKPYQTPVNNLYELATELRRLELESEMEWIGFRDANHVTNAVVFLSPAAIVNGTHVCEGHVYDAVEREVRRTPRF